MLCDAIVDIASNGLSAIANNAFQELVSSSVSKFKGTIEKNELLNIIRESTYNFQKSIRPEQFDEIQYTNEMISKLIEVSHMIFSTLSEKHMSRLNEKNLHSLHYLLDIYKQSPPRPHSRFMSILLTGVPGTGKTTFMQMVSHLCRVIDENRNKNSRRISQYCITGALFLTEKNEATAMKNFLDEIESQIANKQTVLLCIDEAELVFRKKTSAPAVALLIEFMSRMRNTINENSGELIMICCSNLTSDFDQAASRRFISTLVFNHVHPNALRNNIMSKLEQHLGEHYKELIEHILFEPLMQAFLSHASNISFGEIDNIMAHCISHIAIYDLKQPVFALLLAMLESLRKTVDFKYDSDENILMKRVKNMCDDIVADIEQKHNKYISFNNLLPVFFNTRITLSSNLNVSLAQLSTIITQDIENPLLGL